jgi:NhaA family Na+:H+ antiporter
MARWTPILAAAPLLAMLFVAVGHASESTGNHGETAWWLVGLFTLQGVVIWLFARRRYLVWRDGELKPAFSELQEFSSYLLSGAVISQLWIHGDPQSYQATVHDVLATIPVVDIDVSLHFLANEGLMAFFFGIAAKELAEAILKKGGALRGHNGVLPAIACAGGIIGPAVVYRLICTRDMAGAWAVPCATDIAFAWLGARAIWGARHPAVTFLLAVAVADDFIGMGIIAIFYPQQPFHFSGLLLLALGVALALACNRAARRFPLLGRWQAFIIPGIFCWFGLHEAGLHAALALVFVVPFIPMRDRDTGLFAEEEVPSPDSINQFEQSHKPFVDMGLFYFGLANAGVAWWGSAAWDRNSWAVFLGLGIGKTLGITAATIFGFLLLKLVGRQVALPVDDESGEKLLWRDIPVVALLGAMGFTVALFVAEAAGGQASLKLGALASFAYLALAVAIGKATIVRHRS